MLRFPTGTKGLSIGVVAVLFLLSLLAFAICFRKLEQFYMTSDGVYALSALSRFWERGGPWIVDNKLHAWSAHAFVTSIFITPIVYLWPSMLAMSLVSIASVSTYIFAIFRQLVQSKISNWEIILLVSCLVLLPSFQYAYTGYEHFGFQYDTLALLFIGLFLVSRNLLMQYSSIVLLILTKEELILVAPFMIWSKIILENGSQSFWSALRVFLAKYALVYTAVSVVSVILYKYYSTIGWGNLSHLLSSAVSWKWERLLVFNELIAQLSKGLVLYLLPFSIISIAIILGKNKVKLVMLWVLPLVMAFLIRAVSLIPTPSDFFITPWYWAHVPWVAAMMILALGCWIQAEIRLLRIAKGAVLGSIILQLYLSWDTAMPLLRPGRLNYVGAEDQKGRSDAAEFLKSQIETYPKYPVVLCGSFIYLKLASNADYLSEYGYYTWSNSTRSKILAHTDLVIVRDNSPILTDSVFMSQRKFRIEAPNGWAAWRLNEN